MKYSASGRPGVPPCWDALLWLVPPQSRPPQATLEGCFHQPSPHCGSVSSSDAEAVLCTSVCSAPGAAPDALWAPRLSRSQYWWAPALPCPWAAHMPIQSAEHLISPVGTGHSLCKMAHRHSRYFFKQTNKQTNEQKSLPIFTEEAQPQGLPNWGT